MNQQRFLRIVEAGRDMLRTLFTSPILGIELPGQMAFYNAYLGGREVAVLGYQYRQGEHTVTKSIAILVDEELFNDLRVDEESGRYDGDGNLVGKKVL